MTLQKKLLETLTLMYYGDNPSEDKLTKLLQEIKENTDEDLLGPLQQRPRYISEEYRQIVTTLIDNQKSRLQAEVTSEAYHSYKNKQFTLNGGQPSNEVADRLVQDVILELMANEMKGNFLSTELLKLGANPFIKNEFYDCAFTYTVRYENSELFEEIVARHPNKLELMRDMISEVGPKALKYAQRIEEEIITKEKQHLDSQIAEGAQGNTFKV